MKLNIATLALQEMVAKAVKGASNNKMIPITGLMAIELTDGKLTLTTTDATNTLKVIKQDVTGENFYVSVPVDIFSKLVAKTTTDHITLTLQENSLEVKGNGTYSIELPLDEEGQLIKFPNRSFETATMVKKIQLSTVKKLLTTNKVALAVTMETPCLTGYYCNKDEVITTDTFKVCGNSINVFEEPVLIPAEIMELLALMEDENIEVRRQGNWIHFSTPSVVVYGCELEGVEDYPVDAIHAYLNTEFKSVCKLPKTALLNVLDRLALFISNYDKNGLYLTFTANGLLISSKRSNGTEIIKYQGSENFQEFTCCIDIELFKSQVSAQSGEVVELWYGHDTAIKMVSGNVTQIVALLEDDRAEV